MTGISAVVEVAYRIWAWGFTTSLLTLAALAIWTFVPKFGRNRRAEFQRILGADEWSFNYHAVGCASRVALLAAASWLGFAFVVYVLQSKSARGPEVWMPIRRSLRRVEWNCLLLLWAVILIVRWQKGLPIVFWKF